MTIHADGKHLSRPKTRRRRRHKKRQSSHGGKRDQRLEPNRPSGTHMSAHPKKGGR